MNSAGERVGQTGLYWVTHQAHRAAHAAILCEGEKFPCCRVCGEKAHFRFLGMAPESDAFEHAGYDGDFLDSVLGVAEEGSAQLSA